MTLIVLARSGLIPVLVEVAGQVILPATVMAECTTDPRSWAARRR